MNDVSTQDAGQDAGQDTGQDARPRFTGRSFACSSSIFLT